MKSCRRSVVLKVIWWFS